LLRRFAHVESNVGPIARCWGVAGYALRGSDATLTAQTPVQSPPFEVGDTVVLVYQKLHQEFAPLTEECMVKAVRGTYVRCSSDKDSASAEEWRNLAFVVGIAKRAK
jgi:hypothetical protein